MEQLKYYFKKTFREAGVTACVLAGVFAFRSSVAEPYRVPTGSMEPTILPGDTLLVSKSAYGFHLPFTSVPLGAGAELRRGDIVVFRYPLEPSIAYVKRLVGLPGDELRIRDGRLAVNGREVPLEALSGPEPGAMGEPGARRYRERLDGITHEVQRLPHAQLADGAMTVRVPEGMYFFMGDNRDNSADSRRWGFVARDAILGKAIRIAWSLDPTARVPRPRWDRIGRGL